MEFLGISKQEAELRISETPIHQQDTSDVESDLYESDEAEIEADY